MLDFGEFMADITVERQYCDNDFLYTLLSSCHQAEVLLVYALFGNSPVENSG